jgi:hypothetical protein
MNQPDIPGDGSWAVARLLVGAPVAQIEAEAFAEPWRSVAQAVAGASSAERLEAFEDALSKLPDDQAAGIRAQVGKAGRVLLHGEKIVLPARSEITQTDVPDLPQAARLAPALEQAGQEVGHWLNDYVAYAAEVSERTPRLFNEANGLWMWAIGIAGRARLRLRHGDVYPNLYVLGVADTTLYAKSTGLDIAIRLVNDCFPHLLLANDFTPEAMLADLAGREPANLNSSDLTEHDRELWLAGRSFAAQRGLVVEEASAFLAGLRRDYMTGMAELLLRLYDCPDLYRRNTRGAGFVVVRKAYLSIIGMTTPARLQGAEVKTAWHDGLFARFALLTPESTPERPAEDHERPRPAYPPHLVETLTRLAHDLLPVPTYPAPVEAKDVAMTDEARAAWWRYYLAVTYDLLTGDQPPDGRVWGCYGRLPAQALKVALILAGLDWASHKLAFPQVTLAHYARAQAIVESWRASAHRLLNTLAGGQVAAEHSREDRVLHRIRTAGPAGIPARDIYRSLKLRRADFDLLVAGLTRDGLVEEIEIQSPRGPSALGYRAAEYVAPEGTGRQGDE